MKRPKSYLSFLRTSKDEESVQKATEFTEGQYSNQNRTNILSNIFVGSGSFFRMGPVNYIHNNYPIYSSHHQGINTDNRHQTSIPVIFDGINQNIFPFEGREDDIKKLKSLLFEFNNPVVAIVPSSVAIHGAVHEAGIGKTTIAKKYAMENAEYYQICFLFDAQADLHLRYRELAEKINEKLDFLRFINPSMKKAIPIETLASNQISEKVKEQLRNIPDWLLIFDNALNEEQLKDFIPTPHKQNQHTLITSRSTVWLDTKSMSLKVPDAKACIKILKLILDEKYWSKEESLNELIEKLAHLPLAIKKAGAYIKKKKLTVEEYLVQFEAIQQEEFSKDNKMLVQHVNYAQDNLPVQRKAWLINKILSFRDHVVETLTLENFYSFFFQHEPPINCNVKDHQENPGKATAEISLQINRAAVVQEFPLAQDILNFCAFLAANKIHKKLIISFFQQEDKVNDSIDALRKYELIEIDEYEYISIHPIFHSILRKPLENENYTLDDNLVEKYVKIIKGNIGNNEEKLERNIEIMLSHAVHFIDIIIRNKTYKSSRELNDFISMIANIHRKIGDEKNMKKGLCYSTYVKASLEKNYPDDLVRLANAYFDVAYIMQGLPNLPDAEEEIIRYFNKVIEMVPDAKKQIQVSDNNTDLEEKLDGLKLAARGNKATEELLKLQRKILKAGILESVNAFINARQSLRKILKEYEDKINDIEDSKYKVIYKTNYVLVAYVLTISAGIVSELFSLAIYADYVVLVLVMLAAIYLFPSFSSEVFSSFILLVISSHILFKVVNEKFEQEYKDYLRQAVQYDGFTIKENYMFSVVRRSWHMENNAYIFLFITKSILNKSKIFFREETEYYLKAVGLFNVAKLFALMSYKDARNDADELFLEIENILIKVDPIRYEQEIKIVKREREALVLTKEVKVQKPVKDSRAKRQRNSIRNIHNSITLPQDSFNFENKGTNENINIKEKMMSILDPKKLHEQKVIFEQVFVQEMLAGIKFLWAQMAGQAKPEKDFKDKIITSVTSIIGKSLQAGAIFSGPAAPFVALSGILFDITDEVIKKLSKLDEEKQVILLGNLFYAEDPLKLEVFLHHLAKEITLRYEYFIAVKASDKPDESVIPLARVGAKRVLEFLSRVAIQVVNQTHQINQFKHFPLTIDVCLDGLIQGHSGRWINDFKNTPVKGRANTEENLTAEGVFARSAMRVIPAGDFPVYIEDWEIFCRKTSKHKEDGKEKFYSWGQVKFSEDQETPKYGYMLVSENVRQAYDYKERSLKSISGSQDFSYYPTVKIVSRDDVLKYAQQAKEETKNITNASQPLTTFLQFIQKKYQHSHARIDQVWVRDADFTDKKIEAGIYNNIDFRGCIFKDTQLQNCIFTNANLAFIEAKGLKCENVNLNQADLSYANLQNGLFRENVTYIGTIWLGADLTGLTQENNTVEFEKLKKQQEETKQKLHETIDELQQKHDSFSKQITEQKQEMNQKFINIDKKLETDANDIQKIVDEIAEIQLDYQQSSHDYSMRILILENSLKVFSQNSKEYAECFSSLQDLREQSQRLQARLSESEIVWKQLQNQIDQITQFTEIEMSKLKTFVENKHQSLQEKLQQDVDGLISRVEEVEKNIKTIVVQQEHRTRQQVMIYAYNRLKLAEDVQTNVPPVEYWDTKVTLPKNANKDELDLAQKILSSTPEVDITTHVFEDVYIPRGARVVDGNVRVMRRELEVNDNATSFPSNQNDQPLKPEIKQAENLKESGFFNKNNILSAKQTVPGKSVSLIDEYMQKNVDMKLQINRESNEICVDAIFSNIQSAKNFIFWLKENNIYQPNGKPKLYQSTDFETDEVKVILTSKEYNLLSQNEDAFDELLQNNSYKYQ